MIEIAAGDLHVTPSLGVMARLATRHERTVMRILVTRRARRKAEAFILDNLGVFLSRLVTLGAFQVLVLSGQREMRHRMIKSFGCLPVIRIVARLAIGP